MSNDTPSAAALSAAAARDHRITSEMVSRLRGMCRAVDKDPSMIGVFSTGEQIAVALVLDKKELLPDQYPDMLGAVDRLGPAWLAVCIEVQRAGWNQA